MMEQKIKNGFKKLKEEQLKIRKEVKQKTVSYLLGALGLVGGLAWNDAIRALIDNYFPGPKSGILIKFFYAFIITIIIVIITIYLLRLTEEKKEEEKK